MQPRRQVNSRKKKENSHQEIKEEFLSLCSLWLILFYYFHCCYVVTNSLTHFSFADLVDPTSALHRLQPAACLALIGTPVAHSKSPEIHNERMKKKNLPWRYVAIDVQPDELPLAFDLLRKNNFIGFNVTMPHKQQALALLQRDQSLELQNLGSDPKFHGVAPNSTILVTDPFGDEVTDHARLLGAINTVAIRNGKFFGSNTDGPGFVQALQEKWSLSLKGLSVLILGATGGAGRALAMQSALEGCQQLFLESRTPAALEKQVQHLLQVRPGLAVKAMALDESSLSRAMSSVDLVVNTTPVGFFEKNVSSLIPSKLFESRHYAYDIIHSTESTPLMQAASEAGARSANGSLMWHFQGAMAFQTWLDNNGN